MNSIIFYLFIFFFISLSHLSWSQDVQLYGLLPAVLVKKNVNERTDFALGLSSEMNTISKSTPTHNFPAQVLNFNLETLLSINLNPNVNLAGGFLFRLRNPLNDLNTELRPWQQLTTIHRIEQFRIRNRFRAEQRWVAAGDRGNYDFDLRLRYRISTDFPLEGTRLDNREFYLNLSLAAHLTPTAHRPFYFWECRANAGLGYKISDFHRLEPALELRSRRMDEAGNRRNFLFLRITWIVEVK